MTAEFGPINLEIEERTVMNKHIYNPGTWDYEPEIDRIAAILYVYKTRLESEGDYGYDQA